MDHWVCDAWPVWRQTYGYLPSCRASPPFGWYQIILLGDRGTWVWTTCPELILDSGLAGCRTRDLSIASQRPSHQIVELENAKPTYYAALSQKKLGAKNVQNLVDFGQHQSSIANISGRDADIQIGKTHVDSDSSRAGEKKSGELWSTNDTVLEVDPPKSTFFGRPYCACGGIIGLDLM